MLLISACVDSVVTARNNKMIEQFELPHINNICLAEANKPNTLCISKDGKFIATSTWGGGISVISLVNGKVIKNIDSAHEKGVTNLEFSLDGQILYSSSSNEVKIWDLKTNDCLREISLNNSTIHFIAYVKNTAYVAYEESSENIENSFFNLLDLDNGNIEKFRDFESGYIRSLILSKDSSHIISLRQFNENNRSINRLVVWNLDSKAVVSKFSVDVGTIHRTKYPCANQGILIGNVAKKLLFSPDDMDLYIYDILTRKFTSLGIKWSNISLIDISSDNKLILLINDTLSNSHIHIVDIDKSEILGSLSQSSAGPLNQIKVAKFVGNSYDFIISGFNYIKLVPFKIIKNKKVEVEEYFKSWSNVNFNDKLPEIEGQGCVLNITSNSSSIYCAAVSYDKKRIVACTNNKIRIYDSSNGVLLKTITVEPTLQRSWVCIMSVNFTLDDKYIAVRVRRYDPYQDEKYETLGYKLKNYKYRSSTVGLFDSKKNKKKTEKFIKALEGIDLKEKNHIRGDISIYIEGSVLVLCKEDKEVFRVYNFTDDEYVSLSSKGHFIASDNAIKKYVLRNTKDFIPKELDSEDIASFRKTEYF
jgi:hypothetical protein